MTDQERRKQELAQLLVNVHVMFLEHNFSLSGCGCHGSPFVIDNEGIIEKEDDVHFGDEVE